MNTAITLAAYGMAALGVVGCVLAFSPRNIVGRLRLVLYAMVAGLAAFTAVQGFNVTESASWGQIVQAAKLVLYAALAGSLLFALFSPKSPRWREWIGLLAYGLAAALAAAFATNPGLDQIILYPAFVAVIGAIATGHGLQIPVIRAIRAALLFICVGSLIYWAVAPGPATSNPDALLQTFDANVYKVSVIGLDARLHGLTSHGNGLTYVAAMALLLGLYKPARFRWDLLWQAAALVCFVAAQSKTTWIATGVAFAVWGVYKAARLPTNKRALTQTLLVLLIGLGVVAASGQVPALSATDLEFNGRAEVWRITLAEFTRNPIAGYGPGLWNADYRSGFNLPWVGQGHNQVVQTLGQSGLIGLAGLIALLGTLISAAWRSRFVNNGVGLVLVALLIVRGLAETPLLIGPDTGLLSLLAIWLLVAVGKGEEAVAPSAAVNVGRVEQFSHD